MKLVKERENSYINYLLLLGVGLIWGSQFMFNELAIKDFPPCTIAAGRAIIGMFTLAILYLVESHFSPYQTQRIHRQGQVYLWGQFFLIGVFEATLPFFFGGLGPTTH